MTLSSSIHKVLLYLNKAYRKAIKYVRPYILKLKPLSKKIQEIKESTPYLRDINLEGYHIVVLTVLLVLLVGVVIVTRQRNVSIAPGLNTSYKPKLVDKVYKAQTSNEDIQLSGVITAPAIETLDNGKSKNIAGKKNVSLEVEVTNTSKNTITLDNGSFMLSTDQGNFYPNTTNGLGEQPVLLSSVLIPKSIITGYINFLVPDSVTTYKLNITSPFSVNVSKMIEIPLNN